MSIQTVLAIDPGSSKCGLALVQKDQKAFRLIEHTITSVDELLDKIQKLFQIAIPDLFLLGRGTHSKKINQFLQEHYPHLGVLLVDEKNTTYEARARYWEHSKRRGWRRLIPSSMQMPPEPVDDYVALILAERFFKSE